MVKDYVGNKLNIGDSVWLITQKRVATVEKIVKKSIVTSFNIEIAKKKAERYGLKFEIPGHILATSVIKIVTPEES